MSSMIYNSLMKAYGHLTADEQATTMVRSGSHEMSVAALLAKHAPVVEAKPPKTRKAPTGARKGVVIIPFPSGETVPVAADYRLRPDQIDHSLCVGRTLKDQYDNDRRWVPAVYRERQCGAKLTVDDEERGKYAPHTAGLCSACWVRWQKAAETGKPKHWWGKITEEPPAWSHQLGTAWAAKVMWVGETEADSEQKALGVINHGVGAKRILKGKHYQSLVAAADSD